MSGKVIRILPRTAFDFSQTLAGNTGAEVCIAKDVDISGMREGTLLVRLHAVDCSGITANQIAVVGRATAPTTEDPGMIFQDPTVTPGVFVSTTVVTGGSGPNAAPALTRISSTNNGGAWCSFFLAPTRGASGNVKATISIDLSNKD